MVSAESSELAHILQRVTAWPAAQRIDLARRILESIETSQPVVTEEERANETPPASTPLPQGPRPRGYSAAEVIAALQSPQPAPNDETVKRWIDEYRMDKYGR